MVLAFEQRDRRRPARARISARFAPLFQNFLVTFHTDQPGEVRGKSANLTWAARRVQAELIDSGRLDPAHLVVTVCDADSRLHHGYLAALSFEALATRTESAHLPAGDPLLREPLAADRTPACAQQHLLAVGARAHGAESSTGHPVHLFAQLDRHGEVGYWDVDVIPEDSHMCFKVLFHYGQRVKVRPIFLPGLRRRGGGRDPAPDV